MKITEQNHSFLKHLFILAFSMLLCGLLSVHQGKDLSWDLANYHYYNPYAFFNARWNIDYWPSSFIHVHFTPTLDFLTYFLINHFSPIITVFIIGSIHGINLWLLFCIASLMLSILPGIKQSSLVALCFALLGLYGPTALPGIGSFQNDNLVSIFILGFIYLQLRFLFSPSSYFLLITGAFLLGTAAGCKLTAGLFIASAILSLLVLPLPFYQRMKIILTVVLGIFLGFLFSSGYWMFFLWEKYHNPIYPLWNGFFHSPYFPFYNWRDTHYLPKSWLETLLFPFYFSWDGRTGDRPFCDFRFAILYILFIVYACKIIWRPNKTEKPRLPTVWLLWFFLFSYLLWQAYFSIMRYMVVLEMLAPLMIFLILYQLIQDHLTRFATTALLFFLIAVTLQPMYVVRARWYEGSYFNISLPPIVSETQEASVLMPFPVYAQYPNPRPQTYLIPAFPANFRFIGIPFEERRYQLTSDLAKKIKPPLFLLASSSYLVSMYEVAHQLGYKKAGDCQMIESDRQRVTGESLWLCPAH